MAVRKALRRQKRVTDDKLDSKQVFSAVKRRTFVYRFDVTIQTIITNSSNNEFKVIKVDFRNYLMTFFQGKAIELLTFLIGILKKSIRMF